MCCWIFSVYAWRLRVLAVQLQATFLDGLHDSLNANINTFMFTFVLGFGKGYKFRIFLG